MRTLFIQQGSIYLQILSSLRKVGLTLVAVITTTGITPSLVSAQGHLSVASQPAIAATCLSDAEIDNFGRVAPGITRGAQPSDKALALMAKDGIKTIVDLRMNGSGTEDEEATTKRLGLKYVHIPMTLLTPSAQQVSQFLSIVNTPSNLPVFIHCRQGADRTGTLVAIYRRKVQGWDFDKTYVEMREHHFKPFLLGMKDLVKTCPSQNFDITPLSTPMASLLGSPTSVVASPTALVASPVASTGSSLVIAEKPDSNEQMIAKLHPGTSNQNTMVTVHQ